MFSAYPFFKYNVMNFQVGVVAVRKCQLCCFHPFIGGAMGCCAHVPPVITKQPKPAHCKYITDY